MLAVNGKVHSNPESGLLLFLEESNSTIGYRRDADADVASGLLLLRHRQ